MGGILGDHIVRQNRVQRLVRYFSRDARYLYVRLRFGLGAKKDLLAFLYLLFFHFLGCQGNFGTGDMEFTTVDIHIIRMREHHPSLFARVCENASGVMLY